ncbi:hypothetical protein Tco_1442050, partial [Tanacetum coccineum]
GPNASYSVEPISRATRLYFANSRKQRSSDNKVICWGKFIAKLGDFGLTESSSEIGESHVSAWAMEPWVTQTQRT